MTAAYLWDIRKLAQAADTVAAECEALHTAILALRAGRRIDLHNGQHLGLLRQISDVATGLFMPVTLAGVALALAPPSPWWLLIGTSDGRVVIDRDKPHRGGYATACASVAMSITDACLWAHVVQMTEDSSARIEAWRAGKVRP